MKKRTLGPQFVLGQESHALLREQASSRSSADSLASSHWSGAMLAMRGRYFVWEETMVIGTPRTLYVVKTAIPSADLSSRARAFSYVTQWLKDLRLAGQ
jgi:hypothetical protein